MRDPGGRTTVTDGRKGAIGGFTLVELLISVTIMSVLLVSVSRLVAACLRASELDEGTAAVYQQGSAAMEKMIAGVKSCTQLHIPNSHCTTRDVLAFSGVLNEDGDCYFDDVLFPRLDEDPPGDMSGDSAPGLALVDDDGDGLVDETGGLAWEDAVRDDDEDGLYDEDPADGVDNDGDGNIDEDMPSDANGDAAPGLGHMDDDADGSTDEGGSPADDDEDGSDDEDGMNAVIFSYDSGARAIVEAFPHDGSSGVLCRNVTGFSVVYNPGDAATATYITISLTLEGGSGESLTITEDVYPRNMVQKWGRRVR